VAQTRIRTKLGSSGGFLVLARTAITASGIASPATSSMANVHVEGTQSTSDVIRVPVQDIGRGAVR